MRFSVSLPLFLCCLSAVLQPGSASAQTREWRLMRQGNKEFRAKRYDGAGRFYMDALKRNAGNARALFNLADTYLAKGDARAADSLFNEAARRETNKTVRAMAYHNRGYICQKAAGQNREQQQQLLRQAIEMYKQSLRLNPHSDDTRYNLALCQKQLRDEENKRQPQNRPQQQQQQQQQQNRQQQNPQEKEEQLPRQQAEQYLNMSQQAEKRTLQKLRRGQPRRRSLDKNW